MRWRSRQVICMMGSPPLSFMARQPPREGKRITELWWSVTLMASTLSLRISMWWSIFSRLVPLGGATSLVMTNLPELRASLKRDTILLTPSLNSHRPRFQGDMMVAWRLVPAHQVEPALFFQSVINKRPGAILFLVHLT